MLATPISPTAAASAVPPNPNNPIASLNLESTLNDLRLSCFTMELSQPGVELAQALEADPLLPGAVLLDRGAFVGLLSRRRFFKHLSRQYGPELFLKRPLQVMYQYAQGPTFVLSGDTPVVQAGRAALERSPDMLYEPVIVETTAGCYCLLDLHQLLVAQSQIHELAMERIQEQTRAQVIQTEKMASLGRMVAGISHEIKNPVNFIAGNVVYLTQYARDLLDLVTAYEEVVVDVPAKLQDIRSTMEFDFLREDLPKLIDSMAIGADKLKKTVAGLQHFSRLGSKTFELVNLHDCIDSTLIVLSNRLREGVDVARNYADLPLTPCQSGHLSQVFMNLLSNAIDALWDVREQQPLLERSQWQPTISISTSISTTVPTQLGPDRPPELPEAAPAGQGAIAPPQSWVLVEIADNGPGIPEAIQTKIFETFFTTKPIGKGTGLGLAISHDIVARHGGYLRLRSPRWPDNHPDRLCHSLNLPGTVFEVWLPLRDSSSSGLIT
ncbi:MAG TPA: ATP-binding protein [Coleofasciculaceae cyanobacterium]